MSSYNNELERIKLESQIFELKQIITLLNNRLQALEKALHKLEVEVVELIFNPPINIEDAKIKWLQMEIPLHTRIIKS
ncbi:MAG: hypothetical protein DRJ30_07560 [Candidatus Methanomethylicota archaeon]|nr:MAG: hypothetical protein DRJ30_07560 [Candidatus Verstraetearchaeota archaeon]